MNTGASPAGRHAPPATGGLRTDVTAGLNTGLVVAMQALAHGAIAFGPLGPSAAGIGMAAALAASMVAGLVVAAIAGSRPLIGTTSVGTALATAALLGALAPPDLATALLLAMLLALCAGLVMLGLAAAGLGRVAGLIPTPVTLGLVNAIVVLVVISQAPLALGLAPGMQPASGQLHPASLAVAAVALGLMLRPLPLIPPPVQALGAATALHHALLAADVALGPMVGLAPSTADLAGALSAAARALPALPPPGQLLPVLVPAALSLAVLAMLEGVTAVAALRQESGRRADGRRDMLAIGAGMTATGLVGGVPASALSSGTLACWRWGGRGRAAMVVRAGVALPLLAFAGPLIAALPFAALAGMLIAVVLRLLQWRPMLPAAGPGRGRRVADALVILAVSGGAVLFGIVAAVGIGVLLSVVIFTSSMAQTVIRRHTRNPVGRSRVRRPAQETTLLRAAGDRIELIELEGALFFGTAEEMLADVDRAHAAGAAAVILDLGRVTRIDMSGGQRLVEACRAAPGRVLVAPLHPGSRAAAELGALGLLGRIPPDAAFGSLPAAVEAAEEMLLATLRPDRAEGARSAAEELAALGLPPTAVAALLPRMEERGFAAGETILRQGEPADAAYLLVDGEALVTLPPTPGRPPTRLAVLAPGVFFGEAALLGAGRRTADVTARGAVRCLRLGLDDAHALRTADPDAAWHLMAAVARQLAANVAAANATIDGLED